MPWMTCAMALRDAANSWRMLAHMRDNEPDVLAAKGLTPRDADLAREEYRRRLLDARAGLDAELARLPPGDVAGAPASGAA